MERLSVSAVKCGDIVFYRADLMPSVVKNFITSEKQYIECPKTARGNIFLDDCIILQEWDKYKVKSLSSCFEPQDFIKNGEYGSEDFGILQFKNCVGIAKFKGINVVIESTKISQLEMERLISVVNSYIVNLSYDFNKATFSFVERDHKKKTDLNYHVYLMVHNALSTGDNKINIFKNFKLIENNVCRTMASSLVHSDFSITPEVTEESLLQIFSGGTTLKRYNGTKIKLAQRITNQAGKYIPEQILYEDNIETFDNQENQFIKYFITWCLDIISTFHKSFLLTPDFTNIELLKENEEHIKRLKYLLTQTFLKSVGELQQIPMYSTVLTMRDGYRQLFRLYLGIRSMPLVNNQNDNIKEMIENKALDVLYENYCYFGLSNVLATIYDQGLDKKKYKIHKSDYSKGLEKKTYSNYFEFERTAELPRIRVHYNKNYTIESYSKSFDPDISIEIFDESNNLDSIYVFDSKFKVNFYDKADEDDTTEMRRNFKYDDISKMHTYRDALKRAHGAFILYPGTENALFFETEYIDRDLLYGVGAFKIGPGNELDFERIKYYLEKLLRAYKAKGC